MDINTLRGISTVLVMVAFLGVCAWAYSRQRKREFDEAAQLPFADEAPIPHGRRDGKAEQEHRA